MFQGEGTMSSIGFVHCGVQIYAQWQTSQLEDGRVIRTVRCPFCGALVKCETLGDLASSHG